MSIRAVFKRSEVDQTSEKRSGKIMSLTSASRQAGPDAAVASDASLSSKSTATFTSGSAGKSAAPLDSELTKRPSSCRENNSKSATQSSETLPATSTTTKLVFGLNPRAHRSVKKATKQTTGDSIGELSEKQSEQANGFKKSGAASSPASTQVGHIRASKYGNYYKPQDLTSASSNLSSNATARVGTSSVQVGKGGAQQVVTSGTRGDKRMVKLSASDTSETQTSSGGQNNSKRSATIAQSGRAPQVTSASPSSRAAVQRTTTAASVRARSRSPDRSTAQMARRKSFEEDISTMKCEAKPTTTPTPTAAATTTTTNEHQQQPILKMRTQFNILPPPQMSIATTGKGSVVDYAKSRIYDRPAKQILANPIVVGSLDDTPGGQVPASILSGVKPPKTVNVSKARAKWEGGEPFAKCKSRKRLAAQANKKLFSGTWSITSVVATQQLHLQQALAQSSSAAFSSNYRSNPLQTDPSVKVLTRGSVLERIQQYEKAPGAGNSANNRDSLESYLDDEDERQIALLALSRSLSESSSLSSSSTNSLGSDGGEAVMIIRDSKSTGEPGETPNTNQAQYKTRVSSIQQQQQQQQQQLTNLDLAQKTTTGQTAPVASSCLGAQHQRRQSSLRRRSSIGLLGRSSSTQSLIPKFYHPNGKPNTYEIEVQKRNIVACFDKFPERSAQLISTNSAGSSNSSSATAPGSTATGAAAAAAGAGAGAHTNTARRQFHQIALACGYSEYFKVPLQLYVKFQLKTNSLLASIAQQQAATLVRQRKSSTVALNTNGTSGLASLVRRPLTKSASIDSANRHQSTISAVNETTDTEKTNHLIEMPNVITCEQFLACWRELISKAYDNAAQFVHLLTFGQRNYLQPEDFVPLVQSIIDDHPGLKFLRAAPDFHMRYIQTVIARIYYCINRSWTGKLTLQELRKSNLLAVIQVLSQEEDINQITDYFSYEHFYVIYCKFWNLDQDHDLFISKEDLARHNDAAISSRIIERVFAGIVSKQIQKTGKMSYSDFVWFLIAEEDKKHPRSIEYWFRLMDLDGDGYISMYEMEYFYYEQMKRLELMNIEALPFLDSACQILDLINPREKNKISLADLKRTRMATIFFDTFINLEKYLEHESREFVSTRDVVQNGVAVSDWDRYASEEYENLVTEEITV